MRKGRLSPVLLIAAAVAACSGAPEDSVENVSASDVGAHEVRIDDARIDDPHIDGPHIDDPHIDDPHIDPITGLKTTGDWEIVRNNCIGCHSARLITQQRGTAAQWLTMIRWMQEKQNLWQFDADTEARIVAYLAENYPPRADTRRAALAPGLMPPNPYAKDSASDR